MTPGRATRGVPLALVATSGVLLSALAGCSSDTTSTTPSGGDTTLTVAAASSLTEVMPTIGSAFTRDNPGVRVQFSFAGSQDIAAQVDAGAPLDAVALAGLGALEPITSQVGTTTLFTTNLLTIIVPPDNPKAVTSLTDLADVRVSLAAPDVPAGQYAREALDKAGVSVTPVSEEPDVKSVVSRVSLGGADAGIVYVTDAEAAVGEVDAVPIPRAANVISTYPAATVTRSAHAGQAQSFVDFLRSDTAQRLLRQAGFGPVPLQGTASS